MKSRPKKRWLVLSMTALVLCCDRVISARNGKRWRQAFKEDAYGIIAGEWEMFTCEKMPSLSRFSEDFREIDGVSLFLDQEGNYDLKFSDVAKSKFRRIGSLQYLAGDRKYPIRFDPEPISSNSVSGKYVLQQYEKEGWLAIEFENLGCYVCGDHIGMDGNLFFDAPLESADPSDEREHFYYIIPKTPINYYDVISRRKSKK